MRRDIVILIAILLSVSMLDHLYSADGTTDDISSMWAPSTFIVDPNGNGDHTDIQSAVDAASDGDTIRVWNGTFTVSININKPLNLIGNGTDGTVMDGQGTLDHQHLFDVRVDGVNISGFQFRRSSPHHEFGGIGLYSANNNVVDNLFINSNIGIYLAGATHNVIQNNTFKWNIRGIRAELGSDNNLFKDNMFVDNLNYGLYYQDSGHNSVINNTFDRNRASVFLGFRIHNFTIDGNLFMDNINRSALSLTYGLDNSVLNNTFHDNLIGLMIAMESHRNKVEWNNITGNEEGVRIYKMYDHLGPCTENSVNYNLIQNNSIWGLNASWTGGWVTNATNNWWGNSTGPYHSLLNTFGSGDNVSDNVTFIPWLGGEPVNEPPVINETGELYAIEDEEFFFYFNATDHEKDELEWEFHTDLEWISWDPQNHSVSGMPKNIDVGNGTVSLKVTDTFGNHDESVVNISVVNVVPEITGWDKVYAIEDMSYSTDYASTDDGDGNITWSLSTDATWLEIDPLEGTISGTPRNEDVGMKWVNISVNDGNGGTGWRNFTLTVRNTNDPPVFSVTVLDIDLAEDQPRIIDLMAYVSDEDGDNISFTVYHQGMIEINIVNGTYMELIPRDNWAGNENFILYFNDPFIELSIEVNITVEQVNDPPRNVFIHRAQGPYYENTTYIFTGSAEDLDLLYGDSLTFQWDINGLGHLGYGTSIPVNLSNGNYTLTLNVTDTNGTWSFHSIDIEILEKEIVNDTEPDVNDTDPSDDDDDTEPVDDDDTDDDDIEPTDDDEVPASDDDDDVEEKGYERDPLVIGFLVAIIAMLSIMILVLSIVLIKRGREWEEE